MRRPSATYVDATAARGAGGADDDDEEEESDCEGGRRRKGIRRGAPADWTRVAIHMLLPPSL
ncbi:hypothetical protein M6B38_363005 [Iris pallida]|uniref:Uncharacterized protein n=1 Tax=Iris pallida TaxID=29817 RepID=A0AAX6GI08_IRIPA|nr:hypothetical protein M6B38_363005 [Iris pallida]